MVALFAAVFVGQAVPSRARWAVAEFRDLKAPESGYGRIAADDVADAFRRDGQYELASRETVDKSISRLGLKAPSDLVGLERVGQDVRASVIVHGEVVDYRIDPGGPVRAAVRVIAYDIISGLPIGGALAIGTVDLHGAAKGGALVGEAVDRAAAQAVATMLGQGLPTATIVSITTRYANIDRGSRAGFKSGKAVIISRGWIQITTAQVGLVEPDRAEIIFERMTMGIVPGDRVRQVFTPPALPPPGASIFDVLR